jgi:hypothetical protein
MVYTIFHYTIFSDGKSVYKTGFQAGFHLLKKDLV